MTTIAYKDGFIAFDTRQTRRGAIVSDNCSKCQTLDGVMFFLCGSVCDESALIAAYFGTQSSVPVECSGYACEGGKLYMIGHANKTGIWKQELDIDNPDAIGSGAPYALVAMDMGASAEEAVKAAMKRDVYTGGMVRVVEISGRATAKKSISWFGCECGAKSGCSCEPSQIPKHHSIG